MTLIYGLAVGAFAALIGVGLIGGWREAIEEDRKERARMKRRMDYEWLDD